MAVSRRTARPCTKPSPAISAVAPATARSWRAAAALFAAVEQHPNAILLGGGTDLGLRVSKDREALPAVIALEAVRELRHVTTGADAIEFGGAVTYSEI